uniref:Uncharacterized protein n=1 Tax=Clytia hemisphaerica TaxID=252671 RepID=A0A7M5V8A4_9CNID
MDLAGLCRIPAVCFLNPSLSLERINLKHYEISLIEPLHDIKGHIKNMWELLPKHLSKDMEIFFQNELISILGEKDTYRGSDYRLSALFMCWVMENHSSCPREIKELLYTLTEISRLAYLPAQKRSPRFILRAYNITYKHTLLCKQIFGSRPSLNKFYGTYYHSLSVHLPEVFRIIAPSSLFSESEERLFSQIRGILKATSDRKKESIRDVGLIRYQSEKIFQKIYGCRDTTDSRVQVYQQLIDKHENSTFHLGETDDSWSEHLNRIVDYILPQNDPWWVKKCNMIEFFDGDDQPEERSEGPRMFDFKSTSVAEVQHQLKETLKRNWQYISKDLASEPLIDDEENDDERPVLEEECLDDETVLELQIPDELDDNADSGKKLTPNSERQTRSATNGDLSHLFKSKPGKSLYKVFGVTDE